MCEGSLVGPVFKFRMGGISEGGQECVKGL